MNTASDISGQAKVKKKMCIIDEFSDRKGPLKSVPSFSNGTIALNRSDTPGL